jgi:propionyl-CoA carboxylase alpha chain
MWCCSHVCCEPCSNWFPDVRVDTGIREGSEISMYYDPLICKLATHGNTRQEAIDYMVEAVRP